MLALATVGGLVNLLSVDAVPLRDGHAGVLDVMADTAGATATALAADEVATPRTPLPPVLLTVMSDVRVAHAPSGALSALAPAGAGALAGTSEGGLVCVGWDGAVLWRAHVPEVLRRGERLASLGLSRPTLAALLAERSAAAAAVGGAGGGEGGGRHRGVDAGAAGVPPSPAGGPTVDGLNGVAVPVLPLLGIGAAPARVAGDSRAAVAAATGGLDDAAGLQVLTDLLAAAGDDSGGGWWRLRTTAGWACSGFCSARARRSSSVPARGGGRCRLAAGGCGCARRAGCPSR